MYSFLIFIIDICPTPQQLETLAIEIARGLKRTLCSSIMTYYNPHRGVLADPYCEFMVIEDRSLTKEALEEDFNARYVYVLCGTHVVH